ncbi:MAG: Trk system potassium transporter TrkA [Puniceicoccales bacterium]|jgi:trk system potassium uptake protein TrkA|nr:Trk system potassium transporter TrkA [Puniceicoccales bacterium]
MQFVIIGAGEVGLCLCKHLLQNNHEVVIVEKNAQLAKLLGENVVARIVTGDATLFSTLQQINLPQTDAVLAMTQDDAVNILACTLAKTLGAQKTVCRIHRDLHQNTQKFNYQAHFSIDYLIDTQHACAFEIAKYIRDPHRVAIEQFSRGKIEIQTLELKEKSPWTGKTILQLSLDNTVRIGFIKRDQQHFIPTKDTLLQAHDLLTLAGDNVHLSQLRTQACIRQNIFTYITLFSASKITVSLLQLLHNPYYKVKVIEEDIALCYQLAEAYPNISVIHGSATQLSLLQEEQTHASDYFVACSSNDEKNIIACLQAQKAGSKKTLLWVNKEDYDAVCDTLKDTLHFNHLILTKSCIIKDLESILFPQEISVLGTLGNDELAPELIEIHIPSGTAIEGLTVDNIPWPEHTLLLVLKHRFHTKVPGAKDCLIGGDCVVAVVQKKHHDAIIRLLTQKTSL